MPDTNNLKGGLISAQISKVSWRGYSREARVMAARKQKENECLHFPWQAFRISGIFNILGCLLVV
jgi:hypothetical protein